MLYRKNKSHFIYLLVRFFICLCICSFVRLFIHSNYREKLPKENTEKNFFTEKKIREEKHQEHNILFIIIFLEKS